MGSFLIGVVAGFGIAVPVGAIAVLIVQVGMRCGFRCGASAGAGAATADLLYAVLAVAGGAALAATIDAIGRPFRIASAVILACMAILGLVRSARPTAPVDTPLPGRREFGLTYVKFLGLTVVNPLTVVYFVAVVLGLDVVGSLAAGQATAFVAGVFSASLTWQLLLAGVGAAAGRHLPATFVQLARVGGNLLVLGMAVFILVD
jgi:threonine/homoserine/homoserine lactone efflux protein